MKMLDLRLDENGVPRLSRSAIEAHAEYILRLFDPNCLEEPQPTPLGLIATTLHNKFHVKFVFNLDLGFSPEGYKYRGRFHIPTKTVFIDPSLEYGEPRFNFTLAHEISHFILHCNVKKSVFAEGSAEISDTERDLVLDHVQGNSPVKWIEWQANKLASSLLLPKETVKRAVFLKQRELGINRNLGTIYLDRQTCNFQDYLNIINHLQLTYQTSRAATRIRLRELNILIETMSGTRPGKARVENEPESIDNILRRLSESLTK
jgi:Zn-dependent peptidase ImmA (M78 family)